MITRRIIFTLTALFLWVSVAYAADIQLTPVGKVSGTQLEHLEQQINQLNALIINLRTQVKNIQLIHLPQGPAEPAGRPDTFSDQRISSGQNREQGVYDLTPDKELNAPY